MRAYMICNLRKLFMNSRVEDIFCILDGEKRFSPVVKKKTKKKKTTYHYFVCRVRNCEPVLMDFISVRYLMRQLTTKSL